MNVRECVVKRLYELCEQRGITVNAMARISGVHPSTLKSILYGASNNPGIVTIKMFCDGLGISITEFFDTADFRSLEQELR